MTNDEGTRLMAENDRDPCRSALEEIVRVGTTSDMTGTQTMPDGRPGSLWSNAGKNRAFDEMLRIARDALQIPD